MKAKEARELAEKRQLLFFNKSFDDIFTEIKKKVDNGKFECFFKKQLEDDLKCYLEEMGYRVEYKQCGFNEFETRISW